MWNGIDDANDFQNFAHFRRYENSYKCEFSFYLDTDLPTVGHLSLEVNAVRQLHEEISSLLKHIQKKVQKVIKDKFQTANIDVPVYLQRGRKNLNGAMELQNFSTSILSNVEPVVFRIFEQNYKVLYNTPLVSVMRLPSILYAGTEIKPTFYAHFADHKLSKFIWYKSEDKTLWMEVSKGFAYKIRQDDVNEYLKVKCIPINDLNVEGPTVEVISSNRVMKLEEIPVCPFETRHRHTKERLKGQNLRVVSYNILAEKYTNKEDNQYAYCAAMYLSMEYRKRLILKELQGYNADIICLQETDSVHFYKYFKPELELKDYEGRFYKKGNKVGEGLACFFKDDRYKLIKSYQIVLNQEVKKCSHIWNQLQQNIELKKSFLFQNTSLQVTILTRADYILVIGNTHLYYRPEANSIRLIQAYVVAKHLHSSKLALSRKYNKKAHLILCGDFNSSPEKSLYPFMVKGKIHPKHNDCLEINRKGNVILNHEFNFISACGTPTYTNYTPDYKACLDYIFVEDPGLSVKKVVPLPDETELGQYDGLPNKYYPSDHLALVADLTVHL